MKASYLLLSMTNLLLMIVTAAVGLLVDGRQGFARHFLLGVMTGLFTCFVHTVLFMYFVVQDKIVSQSVHLNGLDPRYAVQSQAMKRRALMLSLAGIGALLLAIGLGAAIDWAVPPMVHFLAAITAIAVNGVVFFRQYALIEACGDVSAAAFGE